MKPKLIEKLRKLLGKAGLEDEKIEEVVDLVAEDGEEEVEEEIAEQPEVIEEETPIVEESEGEGKTEEEEVPPAPVEETPMVEEEPLPPVEEGTQEVNPAELIPQEEQPVPPMEEQPMAQEQVVPPMEDHTEELKGQIEELKKTNEGLLTRIDTLEGALKKSGIMSEEEGGADVGIDNPRTPANEEDYELMDSVLNKINGRR